MKTLFTVLWIFAVIAGCSKSDGGDKIIACTLQIQPAIVSFNIVEASTGRDLFFSNNPTHTTSQLCFLAKRDKMYTDTVKPEVIGTGTARYFKMGINNIRLKDTLIMKLPISPESLPSDILAYTIKKTDDKCPQYVLDKAFFNNEEVAQINGKLIIKKTGTAANN